MSTAAALPVARQRCLHHPEREAAARCPECGGFFCRECITEHEDRVICADCLRQLTRKEAGGRRFRLGVLVRVFQLCLSVLVAWIFFYLMGQVLLNIPASVHEGTIWPGEEGG